VFYRIRSATIIGVDSFPIEIEIDLKKGLPQQCIVGLPDPAVREARERVHSAIRNSGFNFPLGRLTINLAPADLKKEGSTFDLAMALGILAASKQINIMINTENLIVVGELSLDGYVRAIRGIIAILERAKQTGIKNIILPYENFNEARLISGLNLYPVKFLKDAVSVVMKRAKNIYPGNIIRKSCEYDSVEKTKSDYYVDFSEVKGQDYAIRAIEVAAAGGHNVLLIGSPGSGKTMIANRIPTILPIMTEKEAIETTKIYSVAGILPYERGLLKTRPFRAPHHTASEVSIIGGGKNPIPGEITLAHNGVLFLDEFPEFKSNVIQSLRQPMESGTITITRADSRITFPARFTLIASMNPCPCGYLFDSSHECFCSYPQISRYYMKLSGPILDRIDIQVEVKPLKAFEIVDSKPAESSEEIRKRVTGARNKQIKRLSNYGITLNSMMNEKQIKEFCVIDRSIQELLYSAIQRYKLSARSYYKTLKVARTIADLAEREKIVMEDVLEALSYREVENVLYTRKSEMIKI